MFWGMVMEWDMQLDVLQHLQPHSIDGAFGTYPATMYSTVPLCGAHILTGTAVYSPVQVHARQEEGHPTHRGHW